MRRFAAFIVLAVAGAAARGEERTDQPLQIDMGGVHFVRYCAACHGIGGRGDGPAAGALLTRPADLTRIAARRGGFPEAEIARFIDGRTPIAAHGDREMPVWGERFVEDIPDPGVAEAIVRTRLEMLLAYLESIQDLRE
jgi:mono/diheme cytochrome c family protein